MTKIELIDFPCTGRSGLAQLMLKDRILTKEMKNRKILSNEQKSVNSCKIGQTLRCPIFRDLRSGSLQGLSCYPPCN